MGRVTARGLYALIHKGLHIPRQAAYLVNALPRANTEFGAVTLIGRTTGCEEIARLRTG